MRAKCCFDTIGSDLWKLYSSVGLGRSIPMVGSFFGLRYSFRPMTNIIVFEWLSLWQLSSVGPGRSILTVGSFV